MDLSGLGAPLHKGLHRVCDVIRAAGGHAWLVGGSVRDCALGLEIRDIDVEVFGLGSAALVSALQAEFALDLVGESFGILKLKDLPIDVGLPRRDFKIGLGHKGFETQSDPDMDLTEAAARRDFTLNAVYVDPLTGEVADPWNGLADLDARRLRHTSDAFDEDPLRVLRGMQLAGRFELEAAPETLARCAGMNMDELPPERVFGEWWKLLTMSRRPSMGLEFLRQTTWLRFFPELADLVGCEQDPGWHPEGDVWVHTLQALDVFAVEKTGDTWEDLVVGLAVLCHDFGKPSTTRRENGRLISPGHEPAGVELTTGFLERMTDNRRLLKDVLPLVSEHMRPVVFHRDDVSDAAIRRLANRVGRLDRLIRVAKADQLGRRPLKDDTFPAGDWLTHRAESLDVLDHVPRPLVLGRHLLAMGMSEGPAMGPVLDQCFQAQLDGVFTTLEDGLVFAAAHLPGGGGQ